jgi:hypothetical protein
LKLTPLKEKKEKDEQPKPSTPIRNIVTRAVTLQARKSGLTPDTKGKDREARKAGDTTRRKGTPRRPKKKEGEGDNDEKHVKLEDSGQSSESEVETSDDGEKQHEESVKVEDGDKSTSNTNKEDSQKDEQPTIIPDKMVTEITEEKEVTTTIVVPKIDPIPVIEKPVTDENAVIKEEKEEEEEDNLDQTDQKAFDLYNKLWDEEHKLREKIMKRESRRRNRASRKIDAEVQRRMNESQGLNSQGPAQIQIDSDSDEDGEDDDSRSTREEVKRLRAIVAQLTDEIQKQQSSSDAVQNDALKKALADVEIQKQQQAQVFSEGQQV